MSGTISRPAPMLGEHTDAVLKMLLRLSAEEIVALRENGAIN
jgi:crotonobetainyl-CoA:carnitine CoA-transferase CaiB-like acyl-CoA transferase